jgi:iron complex outermembrane receptor protein
MLKQKPLAAAVAMALRGIAAMSAQAQSDAGSPQFMQQVEPRGIRASTARSLAVKRDASANVEVVTAGDVGKMPDENLAGSPQRLAGVGLLRKAQRAVRFGFAPSSTPST